MANKQNDNNNESRPRGFSATDFIKKQLERKKAADGNQAHQMPEIALFPITSESRQEKKKETEIANIRHQYLAVAKDYLAAGAFWEAIGVYRAILKLEPENIAARHQLIDALLQNNAKQEAVKELTSLVALYQENGPAEEVTKTYQKILEIDPENSIAKSGLGEIEPPLELEKEKVVTEEIPPSSEVIPPVPAEKKELELVSVSPPESVSEPITEPVVEEPLVPDVKEEEKSLEPITEPTQEPTDQTAITEPVVPPILPDELMGEKPPEHEPPPPVAVGESKDLSPPIPESTNGKLDYYRQLLQNDPKNIDARIGYINAYLEIGLEFELVPEYLTLAESYLEQGNFDSAEKTYKHVLILEPEHPTALQGLATINEKRAAGVAAVPAPQSTAAGTSEDKLIENYRRILQLNPMNSEIAHRLASFYQERNQIDRAAAELQQLGDAYMQRSLFAQAVKVYTEATGLVPENAELQTKLAKAQEMQQSMTAIDSAIKSYKSGLDYGPVKR